MRGGSGYVDDDDRPVGEASRVLGEAGVEVSGVHDQRCDRLCSQTDKDMFGRGGGGGGGGCGGGGVAEEGWRLQGIMIIAGTWRTASGIDPTPTILM